MAVIKIVWQVRIYFGAFEGVIGGYEESYLLEYNTG
jgi:hypothetical protein